MTGDAMTFFALRMLNRDRAHCFGAAFAIAFCTFLFEKQTSVFANVLGRTVAEAALYPGAFEYGGLQ